MIEAAMYGALGVLTTSLLALILIPPFWRRAVRLNRRDIEASLPITRAEIDAYRDQLRAGFAVSTRQLEQTIETLDERLAGRAVELGQKQQIIAHLTNESSISTEGLRLLEKERDLLTTTLATRDLQLTEADEARKAAEKRILDIEARLEAARQQLEIVVAEREAQKHAEALRDAELATLRGELAASARAAGDGGALVMQLAELKTALASEQMRREVAIDEARAAEAARRAFDVELHAGSVALAGLREQLADARAQREALSARLVEAEAASAGAAALRDDNTALRARLAALEAAASRPAPSGAAPIADSAELRQTLLEIGEAVARLAASPATTGPAPASALPAPVLAAPVLPAPVLPAPTPVTADPVAPAAAEPAGIVAVLPPPQGAPPPAERPAPPRGLAERIRALQQSSKAG